MNNLYIMSCYSYKLLCNYASLYNFYYSIEHALMLIFFIGILIIMITYFVFVEVKIIVCLVKKLFLFNLFNWFNEPFN